MKPILLRIGNLIVNLDQVWTIHYNPSAAWSERQYQPLRPCLQFDFESDGDYIRLHGDEATAAWRQICDLSFVVTLPDDSLPESTSPATEGTH